MTTVVILEAVRTAIGTLGGSLVNVPVDHLGATVIREVIDRVGISGDAVDEVIMGQAKQSADASNAARVALLRAGLPVTIPGYTIQRQCGSGSQAIHSAAQQIRSGEGRVLVAGGMESMSTAPYYLRNARYGYRAGNGLLLDPNTESQPGSQPIEEYGNLTMGMTAEYLAEIYGISRSEQDEFALRSQENARKAIQVGIFQPQIVPVEVKLKKGHIRFETDEYPRETSLEKLGRLKPVFKEGGTVTAGNSSGRNDGAAALLLASEEEAARLGMRPKARIIAQASSGVSPDRMGIGPVHSTIKALALAGLTIQDLDLVELNEAFSAQALAVIKELRLDLDKVNPNGGAIALGHPIGATGAILLTKLVHELERTGKRYGLVTLCIAGGMGISTIIENPNWKG
ncbi:thiolase family protein [Sporosarcina saromensis]|uniref:acetyl-CoA C-acetyltransferase n=1 Tax=Sporosarcina saromensis TaxID=359365 RepID=A0ABU4GB57_9BACL|nr:thiolase family protein [Sporosarcina saromensis]MDW0114183.1 thiolase family protein [Sporosarcina saromensis]